MSFLTVNNLTKQYKDFTAVDSISFYIERGEIFGLLGPNGAGKSTTINIISTYLAATTGEVILGDIHLKKQPTEIKKRLGVVPQEIALYEDMTGRENLIFFGKMQGMDDPTIHQRADELLQLISLEKEQNQLVEQYSGGMKRRINIAVAMMHQPELVLMDEPTVGIDPQSRENIYDLIHHFRKQQVTFLYTSHYMQEVERLCDRIAIMDQGKIIAHGTLEELLKLKNDSKSVYKPYGLEELFIQLTGRALRD